MNTTARYGSLTENRYPAPPWTREEILREYPYLEADDISEALFYVEWPAEEVEGSLDRLRTYL